MTETHISNTLAMYDFLEAFGHLARLFPKDAPDAEDKPIINEYYKAARFYNSSELWRAVEVLRDSRSLPTFPRPAELKTACREARSKMPMNRDALPAPKEPETPKGLPAWSAVCSSYCLHCVDQGKNMTRDGLIEWAVGKGYTKEQAERRCTLKED